MRVPFYTMSDCLRLAGIAFCYGFLAMIVLTYSTANGNVTVFWAPGGMALAALLVWGWKFWPAVFVGAVSAGLYVKDPVWVSMLLAAGNTLETLFAVWFIRRYKDFDLELKQPADYLRLALTAISSAFISALIGPSTLLIAGYLNWQTLPHNIFHWWQGDTLGILLATPFFLCWRQFPRNWFNHDQLAETVALYASCFFVGQAVFLNWFKPFVGNVAWGYWPVLFVVWAAVRRGQHGATLVICITAIQSLVGAAQGVGFFSDDIARTGLQNFWLFLLILTLVGVSLGIFIDSRLRAEGALRKSTEELGSLFMNAPVGLFHSLPEGRFLKVNPYFAKMLGYASPEELVERITNMGTQVYRDPDKRTEIVGLMMQNEGWSSVEGDFLCKDGSVINVNIMGRRVFNPNGTTAYFEGFIENITERKRMEEARHQIEMEKALVSSAEALQQTIGSELHDNLGQQLTGTAFLGEVLMQDLQKQNLPEAKIAAKITELLNVAVSQVRQLAQGLYPVELKRAGLKAMLDFLAANTKSIYRIDCTFKPSGQWHFDDPNVELHLFRITQEAVSNAIKHGKATKIDISLRKKKSNLVLEVTDNGIGISDVYTSGLGMHTMQYRASLVGASLQCVPLLEKKGAIPKGTHLSVSFPLNQKPDIEQ